MKKLGSQRNCLKLIVVQGVARSGTNLVWNLLQSHPEIVSPGGETGEIFYPNWARRPWMKPAHILLRSGVRLGFEPLVSLLDRRLHEGRLASVHDRWNRFKCPENLYTQAELESAAVVTKSLGGDVILTRKISESFPQVYVVSVVRNGLAVAEGWTRRGLSARRAAKKYVRAMGIILNQSERLPNHQFLRFEDLVKDPVATAHNLYRFVGLGSDPEMAFRLKAKPFMREDGSYTTSLGQEGQKVWLPPNKLKEVFDGGVDLAQTARLTEEERKTIIRLTRPISERLGNRLTELG